MKATFNIRVGRNDEYHAVSNMPLVETVPVGSGVLVDVFETSVVMSPYFVAVRKTDYLPIRSA